MEIFAKRLKEVRKMRKLPQFELGRRIGFGYTYISNLETGHSAPDLDTLVKLARTLDISIRYLLGDTDEMEDYNQNKIDSVHKND